MRLSRDTISQREQFIREAVRTNPKITGDQLQDLLFQHFGKRMRIGRLYEIKNTALDSLKKFKMPPGWNHQNPDPYDPD